MTEPLDEFDARPSLNVNCIDVSISWDVFTINREEAVKLIDKLINALQTPEGSTRAQV